MKLSLAAVLLVWAGLYLIDYPTPVGDDLYFSGTAINLAHGNGYANPYCPYLDRWGARENFFVFVPLHAYLLAAWIKVFGISRWAFSLFQCCAGAAASFALVELVDCKKLRIFSAVLLSLIVAIILDASGLRPDALGLALFLAEASAEWLHRQARIAWGFGQDENLSNEDLIKEKYRGIRPAPGYPACPDHTEKRLLFDLLQAEKNAQVFLTENFAMNPASSVSGFYFGHPEAKYFGVGMIGRDQVEDYAPRKGLDLPTLEKWLAPNLSYDPDKIVPTAQPKDSGGNCGCGTAHT